ncbi:uncharacterized protein LOC109918163 [Rhincodon typus]|uniref:uncharacterized protein LOC109918163 n=1 Tax=Rhincodon typus TaxID=259920 RepID=UPI00202F3B8C|nr:uncharacterized protein LOC109918163 [Rhincodon typus]
MGALEAQAGQLYQNKKMAETLSMHLGQEFQAPPMSGTKVDGAKKTSTSLRACFLIPFPATSILAKIGSGQNLISIACILGTGILGLPGTVAHAGLQPFLVSFIVGFFMQVLLIYLFVDLLQRCRLVQVEAAKHLMVERIIMQDVSGQDSLPSSVQDEEETEDADHVLLHQNNGIDHSEEEQMPNLHILGALFLNKYMSYVFDLLLILQFISIGISYVLAGSEAFAELLQIRHVYIIPFFTWILSLGIILAQVIIQPITSILTLAKGTLLIITVIVTFVVGSEIHQEIFNDFSSIGTPFLMGTVALEAENAGKAQLD